jgi:hypothetical protein
MKSELDKLLCEKYPKMMVNRHAPMTETTMCWGFECGDGWYNIISRLMSQIQHHIDWKEKQRNWAVEHNNMIAQCREGIFDLFEKHMEGVIDSEYKEKRLAEMLEKGFREVPESIPQVTLDQVKEKFGTLRFYYSGGDDYISGMVSLAESMTAVTCENCGNPGSCRGGGWIHTYCEPCEEARELERKQYNEKEAE